MEVFGLRTQHQIPTESPVQHPYLDLATVAKKVAQQDALGVFTFGQPLHFREAFVEP